MNAHRNTKQKDFVLENLKNRFDHPTVSQIDEAAKTQGIKIGEASIYRILNNFAKEGKVCKLVTKDNVAHFDFNKNNHIHLICNSCNKIIDKPLEEVFDEKFKSLIGNFEISKQDVTLYGICENCQKV